MAWPSVRKISPKTSTKEEGPRAAWDAWALGLFAISLGMGRARTVFNRAVRFLGYFLLVFVALTLLRQVPVLGGIFRIPLFGFFLAAVVVSVVAARAGEALASRNKMQRQLKELGEVDTPQRRGKLGRLLLANGRAAQAVEPLRDAVAQDPETADWHYRLGMALLQTGAADEAVESLKDARSLDESFAYGGVHLQLSEALDAVGEGEAALESLDRFEKLQGVTPESAYRRGRVLKGLGRIAEAKAALGSVASLASGVPKYQRGEARIWAWRAFWGKWV